MIFVVYVVFSYKKHIYLNGTIISLEHILYFLTHYSTGYRIVRFHVAVKFVHVKVALWFPINKFSKKNVLQNKDLYIMINASNEGICVEF